MRIIFSFVLFGFLSPGKKTIKSTDWKVDQREHAGAAGETILREKERNESDEDIFSFFPRTPSLSLSLATHTHTHR